MTALATIVGLVSLVASSGCSTFLPRTDRHDIARDEAKDHCNGTVIEPSFVSPEAIERVEPLYSTVPSRSGHDTHFGGAKLRIRPQPGMTAELLERTLRCHAARLTLANQPSTSPYMLPDGAVKIRVTSEDGAFTAKLSSRNQREAETILARARAFVVPPPWRSRG